MRPSLILAQQVLDFLEECGASPTEQEAAIDVVSTLLRQQHYDAIRQDPVEAAPESS
jgi:hypothetical protein